MSSAAACQQTLESQAVEHRLQALNEYLAVYRASQASCPRPAYQAAVRELSRDILRLRAWGWYLQLRQQGARWLGCLHVFVSLFAALVPVRQGFGKRRARSQWMSRLSSYSLVERAYAALEDELQGRLLTLRLAQHRRPTDKRAETMAHLSSHLEQLSQLRCQHLPNPAELSVICALLGALLRLRQWAGMEAPLTNMMGR